MAIDDVTTLSPLEEAAAHAPGVNDATLSPQEQRLLAMGGTPAQRAEYTRTVSVNVDGYRRALKLLEALFQRAQRTTRPGGVRLTGDGGEGKTFILERFFQTHPPLETTKVRLCPALLLTFSGRPSVSDILLSILLQLGYPMQMLKTQKNAELKTIAVKAMVSCQVKMLIFDEAQHLWVSTTARTQRVQDRIGGQVGEFLKLLYDETGVAFVFSGTNGLKDAFARDTQANTRWSGLVSLEPFKDDAYFRAVLDALDAALPMKVRSSLSRNDMATKMFQATQGNFRRLKALLAEAVFVAATDGAQSLEMAHLARAYFQTVGTEVTPFGECEV